MQPRSLAKLFCRSKPFNAASNIAGFSRIGNSTHYRSPSGVYGTSSVSRARTVDACARDLIRRITEVTHETNRCSPSAFPHSQLGRSRPVFCRSIACAFIADCSRPVPADDGVADELPLSRVVPRREIRDLGPLGSPGGADGWRLVCTTYL